MSQADIDEWLSAQTGEVDQNVLEAMRGIADQAAMRVPVARAAAVPPAPGRNADQGETGLRWTESSSTSGIEAWGGWSQTARDITLRALDVLAKGEVARDLQCDTWFTA